MLSCRKVKRASGVSPQDSMPRKLLTGTFEEQCAFLYNVALEKMAAGNYTGAIHALKEILTHAPAYPGAQALMDQARQAKREQQLLLWGSFAGAIIATFFGTLWQVPNDLWLLVLALAGAGVGFVVGNGVSAIMKGRAKQRALANEPGVGKPKV